MKNKVLKLLQDDSRLSPKEIAVRVGSAEAKVKKLMDDCEKKGILRGFKALVDWEKAGVERCYALVDVKVSPAREVGFDDIAERIYRFPEVKFVYLVSGLYDLSMMVEGRTMHDIAKFVSEKLAPIDRVQQTITHFIMKKYKEEGVIFGDSEDQRIAIMP